MLLALLSLLLLGFASTLSDEVWVPRPEVSVYQSQDAMLEVVIDDRLNVTRDQVRSWMLLEIRWRFTTLPQLTKPRIISKAIANHCLLLCSLSRRQWASFLADKMVQNRRNEENTAYPSSNCWTLHWPCPGDEGQERSASERSSVTWLRYVLGAKLRLGWGLGKGQRARWLGYGNGETTRLF